MEMLMCTAGAVGVSTMRVTAAFARPVAEATRGPSAAAHRPDPLPGRSGPLGGSGIGQGSGGLTTDSKDAVKAIDPTSFPTRLGPPPDSPPVN